MMAVKPARANVRKSAKKPPQMRFKTFPAPNAGLVLSGNLTEPAPRSAVVLNNGFPTLRGVRVRGGSTKHATIGSFPVESMFTYEIGSTSKFFATGNGSIFEITAPADPDVAPSAAVTGQSEDYYSTTSFSTAAGDYLYLVNGSDSPLLYDGSTFTAITGVSSPAITGVTTSLLSQVFSYKNRLFFVEGGTFKIWYLAADSISGAATSFSLAGVFKKGGSLLFGATWSQDAGDGLDDKLVLVTTKGEVAIYEGSNPASDFSLVGRYEISPPLGKNAFTSAGGDLVIMTQSGMVPISEAVRRELSVLNLAAISRNIEPLWKENVSLRTLPWEIIELPVLNMGVVSLPHTGSESDQALVVNLQTSAWGVYTGWDTNASRNSAKTAISEPMTARSS